LEKSMVTWSEGCCQSIFLTEPQTISQTPLVQDRE
jgi:hypothetical protein